MILVAGEALIDLIPSEGLDGRRRFLPVPGGSPFNVALALGRLGMHPKFLCGFSQDRFGRILGERLKEAHVDLSDCPELSGLTTIGFAVPDSEGKTEYAFYTEGTAGCDLQSHQLPSVIPPDFSAIHFGSFSLAVEPFGSALEMLCMREATCRVISFDPNIRPFLIHDRARYERRLEAFVQVADVVKLSDEDLEWLAPGTTAEVFAADQLAQGISLVIVTAGSGGCHGFCSDGDIRIPAEAVQISDTIGAGATFQEAVLTALSELGLLEKSGVQRMSVGVLERVLRFASAAAAINCTRPGGDPPRRQEIKAF